MFNNERTIEIRDIVQFHQAARGRVWVGIVVEEPLDLGDVFVRWWYQDTREWSSKQRIPQSMLYLIGPLPLWAEWDL